MSDHAAPPASRSSGGYTWMLVVAALIIGGIAGHARAGASPAAAPASCIQALDLSALFFASTQDIFETLGEGDIDGMTDKMHAASALAEDRAGELADASADCRGAGS